MTAVFEKDLMVSCSGDQRVFGGLNGAQVCLVSSRQSQAAFEDEKLRGHIGGSKDADGSKSPCNERCECGQIMSKSTKSFTLGARLTSPPFGETFVPRRRQA